MPALKLLLFIVVILLSSCIIVPTYNTSISVKSTDHNEQESPIGSVLLIGTGPVASRIFLDNLSTEMIQSFKVRGIPSNFSYIGKVPTAFTVKIDSLVTDQYDTYILFKATDNSILDMTRDKFAVIGPGGGGVGYGNQYAEKYTVMLYSKKEKLTLLWQGDLDVDFDLANDSRYKKISKLLFTELKKNRFLQK